MADMAEELWGHSGSEATEMIRRSDGEASNKTVKDVVARRQGGRVSLELAAEEAGKTVGARPAQSIGREGKIRMQCWKLDYTVDDPVGSDVCFQVHDRHR